MPALDGVSFELKKGGFLAIMGASGSGKSTLLHLLAGLDQPDQGEVHVAGVDLHGCDENALTQYRRHKLGIVFQFFNLLPTMTVVENVSMPLLLQGAQVKRATEQAMHFLSIVRLEQRAQHFPHQLSGGEMQRTALARALVHEPALLLADEPTGNLDSQNAQSVLEELSNIHQRGLCTIVMVTHSVEAATRAQETLQLADGKVVTSPAVH